MVELLYLVLPNSVGWCGRWQRLVMISAQGHLWCHRLAGQRLDSVCLQWWPWRWRDIPDSMELCRGALRVGPAAPKAEIWTLVISECPRFSSSQESNRMRKSWRCWPGSRIQQDQTKRKWHRPKQLASRRVSIVFSVRAKCFPRNNCRGSKRQEEVVLDLPWDKHFCVHSLPSVSNQC